MNNPMMLRAKLGSLRRLIRLSVLTVGIGRLACLAAVLALGDCALDRTLRLGLDARAALLVAGGALVLWQLTWHVILPLGRRLPEQALALEVEERRVGPPDLLSSALQFAGASAGERSASLSALAVARAESVAAGLALAQFIRWPLVRGWAAAGASAVILLGAALAFAPGTAALWTRRNLLLGSEEWPRRTHLTLLAAPQFVPRGGSAQVRVQAAGVVPRTARLRLRDVQGGGSREILMDRLAGGVFAADLTGLAATSAVSVRAGDAALGETVLTVVDRPSIALARMVVTPPAYIASAPVELAWNAPAFDVPEESSATVVLEVTKDLSSASCRVDDGGPQAMALQGPRTAQFTFDVTGDARYAFSLTDTQGIEGERPLTVDVRSLKDHAPDVRLAAVGVGDMLVPGAQAPLSVDAQDDYALQSVWLDQWYEGPNGRSDFPRRDLWAGAGEARFQGNPVADLQGLDLPAQGRLTLAAGARDNCAVGGPNTGQSAPLRFRLVTVQELLGALLLQQQDLRRDLEQQIQRQDEARRRLADQGVGETQPAAPGGLEQAERDVGDVLNTIGSGYRNVLRQMLNNRVLSEAAYDARAAGIAEPLEGLASADGAVRLAVGALKDLRDGRPEAREKADGLMAAAAATMEDVRGRMMLLENFASLVASVAEISADQQNVLRQTEERQKQMLQLLEGK